MQNKCVSFILHPETRKIEHISELKTHEMNNEFIFPKLEKREAILNLKIKNLKYINISTDIFLLQLDF